MSAWVYIMSNRKDGVLYIGVTADLSRRIIQHREGKGSAFCRRYGLTRLVYAEKHDSIEDAIAREKTMKAWKRAFPAFAGMTWRGRVDVAGLAALVGLGRGRSQLSLG